VTNRESQDENKIDMQNIHKSERERAQNKSTNNVAAWVFFSLGQEKGSNLYSRSGKGVKSGLTQSSP
jgi:hypothetical protein